LIIINRHLTVAS